MSFKALNICFLAVLIPVHVAGQCLSNLTELPSYSTKSPISLNTSMTIPGNLSDISFNGSSSSFIVKNTGIALEIISTDEIEKSIFITGGVLCDKQYIFHKIFFFINLNGERCSNTINDHGFPLELNAIYYDPKYKSFDEALGKPAGVVVVALPFNRANIPDLGDDSFLVKLVNILSTGNLTKPNSTAEFPAMYIFKLMTKLFSNAPYFACIGSYFGAQNGTESPGSINIILTRIFLINHDQFQAFRQVENANGEPLELIAKIFAQGPRPVYKINKK